MSYILKAFDEFPSMNIGKYSLRQINIGDCSDIFEIYSDSENSKVQIGYILNKKYWKMGIMHTCIKEIINYLINELQVRRIEAMIDPRNISSINLVKKLGFFKEDLLPGCAYNPMTNKQEDRCLYVLQC